MVVGTKVSAVLHLKVLVLKPALARVLSHTSKFHNAYVFFPKRPTWFWVSINQEGK